MQIELNEDIPYTLKNTKQWIVLNADSHLLGCPIFDEAISNLNDVEFLTYSEAIVKAGISSHNKVRFVLTKEDSFVAVAIRSAFNSQGRLTTFAEGLVDRINSYAEYTEEGDVFLICQAILPNGNQRKTLLGIELIECGVLQFTGNAIFESQIIRENTRGVMEIYKKYFNPPKPAVKKEEISYSEIVNQLSKMKQGATLIDLYNGDWKPYFNSQMEAELFLCKSLAKVTNHNKKLMGETFRQSKLYRKLWDQEIYNNGHSYGETLLDHTCKVISNEKNKNDNKFFLEPSESKPTWYLSGEKGSLTLIPAILAEYIANQFQLLYCNEMYYQYEDGVYKERCQQEIKNLIQRHLYRTYAKSSHIRETEEFLRNMLHKPDHTLNSETSNEFINFKNGLVHVSTKQFTPHTPKHLTSIQMNCYYDPHSEAPHFFSYLSKVLDNDAISLVQEFLGYLLIPNTKAQKAFLLYGPGRSGKSTFLQIIEMLIGQDNISNVAWHDLEDKFQPATLFGKLVNIFGDLPASSLKDTSNFKSLTGGDTINAQYKNKQIFSFKNKARLVFSCNQLPTNNVDRTDAFYRRIVLIPFINPIAHDKVDPHLIDKLYKEKEGIVQWALQGLYRLMKNEYVFTPHAVAEKILEQYKTNNDSVLWFMKNYCNLDLDVKCFSQDLYHSYKQHCKTNVLQAKTQPQFNDDILRYSEGSVLKDKEPKTKKAIYKGIAPLQ